MDISIKKKEGKWRLFEMLTHKEIILDYVDIIWVVVSKSFFSTPTWGRFPF